MTQSKPNPPEKVPEPPRLPDDLIEIVVVLPAKKLPSEKKKSAAA